MGQLKYKFYFYLMWHAYHGCGLVWDTIMDTLIDQHHGLVNEADVYVI